VLDQKRFLNIPFAIYNRESMHPARIAELLAPFLAAFSFPGGPEQRQPARLSNAGDSAATCHSEGASVPGEPAVLSSSQLQAISTYIDLLERWNSRINLTAIRNPDEIVTRHFGESLFAARHLFPATTTSANDQRPTTNDRITVADLGSGAGFPGLPIKLWAPEISLTLIESNHKKATFLREVTRALTLTDVNIQTARAETLTGIAFDVVTLRAVERFESILPVAAGLVAPSGRLALLVGSAQLEASASHALPAFSWASPQRIPASKSRMLAIATRR